MGLCNQVIHTTRYTIQRLKRNLTCKTSNITTTAVTSNQWWMISQTNIVTCVPQLHVNYALDDISYIILKPTNPLYNQEYKCHRYCSIVGKYLAIVIDELSYTLNKLIILIICMKIANMYDISTPLYFTGFGLHGDWCMRGTNMSRHGNGKPHWIPRTTCQLWVCLCLTNLFILARWSYWSKCQLPVICEALTLLWRHLIIIGGTTCCEITPKRQASKLE